MPINFDHYLSKYTLLYTCMCIMFVSIQIIKCKNSFGNKLKKKLASKESTLNIILLINLHFYQLQCHFPSTHQAIHDFSNYNEVFCLVYLEDRNIVFWAMLTVNIGPSSQVVEETGISGVPDSIRFTHKFTMYLHYFFVNSSITHFLVP